MPQFFASCPKGIESLLHEEIKELGAESVKETVAGVHFSGSWETAYRTLIWSRLASRILHPILTFTARTTDELYQGALKVRWDEHLTVNSTFRVDCSLRGSPITHSRFAALRVKDAIVDQFRQATGHRPSVDPERPDLSINVHLRGDQGVINIDLSGEALHRRGYRMMGVEAPLKENTAAAVLRRAGWKTPSAEGQDHSALPAFIDPMCGSGTFVIEAAMIAADVAPGLLREDVAIRRWKQCDLKLYDRLISEAGERRRAGFARGLPLLMGFDRDPRAITAATANARRAGFGQWLRFEKSRLEAPSAALKEAAAKGPGLLVTNPPYGERLEEEAQLPETYAALGRLLREQFQDWKAAVFTGAPAYGKNMGLRARKRYRMYNGSIECDLLIFEISEKAEVRAPEGGSSIGLGTSGEQVTLSESATAFRNRLEKMLRHLGKWARKEGLDAYRVYDADIPEYNAAIDIYGDSAVIQEYEAPAEVPEEKAKRRLAEIMLVAPEVLGIPRDRVHLKVRKRQKGKSQYEKLDEGDADFFEVREYGHRFLVNLTKYLDTGLFLDHRLTRRVLQEEASGKRFLNLFAYTGTATVYAAAGGASSTMTVDMSHTYLDWARRNMRLNGFTGPEHRYEQDDCLEWLASPSRARDQYDLIFIDPPTFSASKRMDDVFEVQRDHVRVLTRAARILSPEGAICFSTNFRKFKLDEQALAAAGLQARNISKKTLPKDFERNPRIHACWWIQKT